MPTMCQGRHRLCHQPGLRSGFLSPFYLGNQHNGNDIPLRSMESLCDNFNQSAKVTPTESQKSIIKPEKLRENNAFSMNSVKRL